MRTNRWICLYTQQLIYTLLTKKNEVEMVRTCISRARVDLKSLSPSTTARPAKTKERKAKTTIQTTTLPPSKPQPKVNISISNAHDYNADKYPSKMRFTIATITALLAASVAAAPAPNASPNPTAVLETEAAALEARDQCKFNAAIGENWGESGLTRYRVRFSTTKGG